MWASVTMYGLTNSNSAGNCGSESFTERTLEQESYMNDELQQMIADMKACSDWDTEVAHGEADMTLLRALRLLANDANRDQITELITAWTNLDKWYS